ncbi:DUF4334 domain-containing protein ['Paenibacillus yunnanensis' Narsing Rao et al. 2020]|uniref:DUF4334 domain-containing protein n=1 Tax=Paenibacillus tengchongensis TaxID=2608684 RepID=UPI00124E914D|nr:DUF4334 domain-containing protein [Paenibacillus tengchongensis]
MEYRNLTKPPWRQDTGHLSQKEAFAWFDGLEPAGTEHLRGRWRGRGLFSGHPLDGLLEALNWYGKEFIDDETVHPLLFSRRSGRLLRLNPGLLPLSLPFGAIPRAPAGALFRLFSPLLGTRHAKARLRFIQYRGKLGAAMVYDRQPIIDHFRRIDGDTLLGVMDIKGESGPRYFFVLERETKEIKVGKPDQVH